MPQRTRTHKGVEYQVSEAHPAADAFPWLGEDELQELADDIREHRQEYKVVRLHDERVIDGRNRELACRIADVEPQYRTEDMTEDEVIDFVISANVHRRNLSASQRAMAAAELANMKQGRPAKTGTGAPFPTDHKENKHSVADAAQKLDVSERSVKSAKKVKDKAPELTDAVKSGELDVKTAAAVADLPRRERKKVAESDDPKAAAKKALAKAEAKKPDPEPNPDSDESDPENPEFDPRFMPNAAEASAFADQFRNWVARLRAVRTELRKALPDRNHAIANRIDAGGFDAALGDLVETLDKNVPECVCPVCVGTGTADERRCQFCDGYGIVDRHHHAGLKAKWKHTRARLEQLKEAA